MVLMTTNNYYFYQQLAGTLTQFFVFFFRRKGTPGLKFCIQNNWMEDGLQRKMTFNERQQSIEENRGCSLTKVKSQGK